jgi:hypothetical protein
MIVQGAQSRMHSQQDQNKKKFLYLFKAPELQHYWFQKLFLSHYFHGKRAKNKFKTLKKNYNSH